MPYFKRKPIIEEAIQYEEGKSYLVATFVEYELDLNPETKTIDIVCGEKTKLAVPGDWIVLLITGDHIILSDQDFQNQYQPAKRKKIV